MIKEKVLGWLNDIIFERAVTQPSWRDISDKRKFAKKKVLPLFEPLEQLGLFRLGR